MSTQMPSPSPPRSAPAASDTPSSPPIDHSKPSETKSATVSPSASDLAVDDPAAPSLPPPSATVEPPVPSVPLPHLPPVPKLPALPSQPQQQHQQPPPQHPQHPQPQQQQPTPLPPHSVLPSHPHHAQPYPPIHFAHPHVPPPHPAFVPHFQSQPALPPHTHISHPPPPHATHSAPQPPYKPNGAVHSEPLQTPALPHPTPPAFIPHLTYMEGQFATQALLVEQQRRIKALEAELAATQVEVMRLRAAANASATGIRSAVTGNAVQPSDPSQQSSAAPAPHPNGSTSNGTASAHETEGKKASSRYWTADEHQRFLEGLQLFGQKDIKAISRHVGTRSATQVRTHAQKYYLRIERERAKAAEGSTTPCPTLAENTSEQQHIPNGKLDMHVQHPPARPTPSHALPPASRTSVAQLPPSSSLPRLADSDTVSAMRKDKPTLPTVKSVLPLPEKQTSIAAIKQESSLSDIGKRPVQPLKRSPRKRPKKLANHTVPHGSATSGPFSASMTHSSISKPIPAPANINAASRPEHKMHGMGEHAGSMSNLRALLKVPTDDQPQAPSASKPPTLRRNGSSNSVLADLSKGVGVLSRSNSFLSPAGKTVTRSNSILSLLSGIPTALRDSPSTERLLGLDSGEDKVMATLKSMDPSSSGPMNSIAGPSNSATNSVGAMGDRSYSFGQLHHMASLDDLEDPGAVALELQEEGKWADG